MVLVLLRWLGPRMCVRVGVAFVVLGLALVGLSIGIGGTWWIHGVVLTAFGVLFVAIGARRGRRRGMADAVEHVAVR